MARLRNRIKRSIRPAVAHTRTLIRQTKTRAINRARKRGYNSLKRAFAKHAKSLARTGYKHARSKSSHLRRADRIVRFAHNHFLPESRYAADAAKAFLAQYI